MHRDVDRTFSLEIIATSVVAEVCREALFAVATPVPKPRDEDTESSDDEPQPMLVVEPEPYGG